MSTGRSENGNGGERRKKPKKTRRGASGIGGTQGRRRKRNRGGRRDYHLGAGGRMAAIRTWILTCCCRSVARKAARNPTPKGMVRNVASSTVLHVVVGVCVCVTLVRDWHCAAGSSSCWFLLLCYFEVLVGSWLSFRFRCSMHFGDVAHHGRS